VRRAAHGLSCIGRDDHWQLAEYPNPARESIRAICSLQDSRQDWRRKPNWLSMLDSCGEPFDFKQIVAASICDPHG
jgi:hypothetical protein